MRQPLVPQDASKSHMKERAAPFIVLVVLGAVVTAAGIAQARFGAALAEYLFRPKSVSPMPELYWQPLPVLERPRFRMPVYGLPFDPAPPAPLVMDRPGSVAT